MDRPTDRTGKPLGAAGKVLFGAALTTLGMGLAAGTASADQNNDERRNAPRTGEAVDQTEDSEAAKAKQEALPQARAVQVDSPISAATTDQPRGDEQAGENKGNVRTPTTKRPVGTKKFDLRNQVRRDAMNLLRAQQARAQLAKQQDQQARPRMSGPERAERGRAQARALSGALAQQADARSQTVARAEQARSVAREIQRAQVFQVSGDQQSAVVDSRGSDPRIVDSRRTGDPALSSLDSSSVEQAVATSTTADSPVIVLPDATDKGLQDRLLTEFVAKGGQVLSAAPTGPSVPRRDPTTMTRREIEQALAANGGQDKALQDQLLTEFQLRGGQVVSAAPATSAIGIKGGIPIRPGVEATGALGFDPNNGSVVVSLGLRAANEPSGVQFTGITPKPDGLNASATVKGKAGPLEISGTVGINVSPDFEVTGKGTGKVSVTTPDGRSFEAEASITRKPDGTFEAKLPDGITMNTTGPGGVKVTNDFPGSAQNPSDPKVSIPLDGRQSTPKQPAGSLTDFLKTSVEASAEVSVDKEFKAAPGSLPTPQEVAQAKESFAKAQEVQRRQIEQFIQQQRPEASRREAEEKAALDQRLQEQQQQPQDQKQQDPQQQDQPQQELEQQDQSQDQSPNENQNNVATRGPGGNDNTASNDEDNSNGDSGNDDLSGGGSGDFGSGGGF